MATQLNDEGRIEDLETIKTQKGYEAYQDEGKRKQKELEARDQRVKEGARKLMDSGKEMMTRLIKTPEKPTKMAKGGTASSRADGCAQRGKTKGVMVMCGGGMTKGKK
jgi:hypothetical protein